MTASKRPNWRGAAAGHWALLSAALMIMAGCQTEPAGTNPLKGAQPEQSQFDAVVVEVHAAGPYTYHALRAPSGGETWLVTLGDGQPVGTQVAAKSYATREDFRSRRLNRAFETMRFGSLTPSK